MNAMKLKYEEPKVEVIRFEDEDVVRASGTELPIDEATFRGVSRSFNLF